MSKIWKALKAVPLWLWGVLVAIAGVVIGVQATRRARRAEAREKGLRRIERESRRIREAHSVEAEKLEAEAEKQRESIVKTGSTASAVNDLIERGLL